MRRQILVPAHASCLAGWGVLRTLRAIFPCGFQGSHSPPPQDTGLRRLFAPIPTPDYRLPGAETHRARSSLRTPRRLLASLVDDPRPVVQAGERVPAGDGRGAASAARAREGAQGQPGRKRRAAGRGLRQCGRHGGTVVPRPFPAEPHNLWRPLEAGRVAGNGHRHGAARRSPRSPAGASRAPRPRAARGLDGPKAPPHRGPAPLEHARLAAPPRPTDLSMAASGRERTTSNSPARRGVAEKTSPARITPEGTKRGRHYCSGDGVSPGYGARVQSNSTLELW